mmetsp:Transcript_52109/g.83049  ORF Transcript_52109/g.83049 Transcript_52109/m.83049 type:complete len:170 (+) Transcript_52109:21-530(+)
MATLQNWTQLMDKQTMIKLFIWCLCWFLISYFVQFGSIFLCISIIYFIFNNLGQRKDGQLSAYAMFNENYERIAGTFDSTFYEDMLRGKKSKSTFDGPSSRKHKQQSNGKKLKHPKRLNKSGNMKCPCGSNKKYKKCCMKLKLKEKRAKIQQDDMFHFSSPSDSSDLSD